VKELGELLSAIGTLLWPIFAFIVFFTYKEEFRTLFRRLRRGKLLGQEVELEESLVALEASAKQAIIEVTARSEAPQAPLQVAAEAQDEMDLAKIIELAAQSPKAALLILASDIERELRVLLASTGWHGGRRVVGLKQGFEMLRETESLPPHVGGSVRLFADMRSRLVHGVAASDDDVLRALDSGLTILKALRAIPHENHVVHHPGVDVFADPDLKQQITDVRAVILESTSPGGATKRLSVYPTTKRHFQKGKPVAWEWNFAKKWGPAWYKDPDSGEVKQAWGGAMEFIGRHLEDLDRDA
jgi:hypothetical protein